MLHPRNDSLLEKARELRKNMTEEKKKLWFMFLRKHRLRFRRQEIIGNYIADFYCKERKIVIEVDGSQHYEHNADVYDKERTEYFEELGITVVRIMNSQVNKDFQNVCLYLNEILENEG